MERIEHSELIDEPLHDVYLRWTQFIRFPPGLDGVKSVRPLDSDRLEWRAELGGKHVMWETRITENVPDWLIGWHSESGDAHTGKVEFRELSSNCTVVNLVMEYELKEPLDSTGDSVELKHVLEAAAAEVGLAEPIISPNFGGKGR
jgi:uncharacterized membrane protein